MNSSKHIQDPVNKFWHPFATSTPLNKVFPKNIQKQLVKPVDKVNALFNCGYSDSSDQNQLAEGKCQTAKRFRKAKSSYYFGVSPSSSEDENSVESNKTNGIKINDEKNSGKNRSVLKNKNLKKEKVLTVKKKITPKLNKSKSNKTCTLKKVAPLLRKKNVGVVTRGKNKIKNDVINSPENHLENKNSISNEIHSISNEDVNKENLKVTENNGENIINNNDSLNKLNDKNINRKTSGEVIKVNKLITATENDKLIPLVNESGKKSALKDLNNDFRQPKSSEASNPQINEALKNILKKRKASKLSSLSGPAQKIKRKTKTTNPKPGENQSVLHIWDSKKNLSHQLFSESKEQELINSLDLTDVETNKQTDGLEVPSNENKKESPLPKSKSQNPKSLVDEKEELRRPTRQRQAPKKYWLPETPSPKPDTVNKKQRIKQEPNKTKQVSSPSSLKNKSKSMKTTKNRKNQTGAEVLEKLIVYNQNNQEPPVDNLNPFSNGEIKQTSTDSNKIKSKSSKAVSEKRQLRSNRNTRKKVCSVTDNEENNDVNNKESNEEIKSEEKAAVDAEDNNNKILDPSDSTVVFKQLNQLSFNKEILEGCTKSDCWALKNFKCGVMKIKSQSNLSSKNNQDIYFGGVLIVGNLKMKIGNKELDMKEGDLAFVPPQTEWTAANFGKTESVFYYWRGRFNPIK